MPRALLAAFAVLVLLSIPSASSAGSISDTLPVDVGATAQAALGDPVASAAANAVVSKVNAVRRRYGLRRLRTSRSLMRSSKRFARHLMKVDHFGHARRIHTTGFRHRGEALALQRGWGPGAGLTVRSWMRSPSHRALLLSRSFDYAGVGRARGRFGRMRATIYVLHLGAH
jgi:uncharacterized protein YkwD